MTGIISSRYMNITYFTVEYLEIIMTVILQHEIAQKNLRDLMVKIR